MTDANWSWNGAYPIKIRDQDGFTVCDLFPSGEKHVPLITAVPEMFDALQAMVSAFMSHTQWNGEPPVEVVTARAIIAKITGSAS